MKELHPIMKKLTTLTVALVALASTAVAQPYPSNGFVGVYSDANLSSCCTTVVPFAQSTLHVIATLAGGTATGITGAEFRIEISGLGDGSAGTPIVGFNANPAAILAVGDPIDRTPGEADPNTAADDKGLNIAFAGCQPMVNPPPGSHVLLGTISVIVLSSPAPTADIVIKRREPPSNVNFACPLFTLCDDPVFTKVCMTVTQDVIGQEPIGFRSKINGCPSTDCGFVGVSEKTWSGVKSLFR